MSQRWLLDTSAYSRRHIPAVARNVARRVESGEELLISAPTLLELLRTPLGSDVAGERSRLSEAFEVLPLSASSGELAAEAMAELACAGRDGHRLPVPDLLTAALASEHELGVLHLDSHFDELSGTDCLHFKSVAACAPDEIDEVTGRSPATRQRQLRRSLNAALSRLPIERAEALLVEFVAQTTAAAA